MRTVNEYVFDAVKEPSSFAVTSNVYVVFALTIIGVPEITPVESARSVLFGKLPEDTWN